MGYSENALAFATIGVAEQVRLSDRLSYLYLEHAQIVQNRTGLLALRQGEEGAGVREAIHVPIGSLATILLGPGTSITHAAVATIANAGATLLFTGGGGVHAYAAAKPLTTSARWAEAQARLWTSQSSRVAAARILYQARFGALPVPPNARLATLRGIEGQMMRAEYKRLAIASGVKFRRETAATDAVNAGLNIGNSILYGLAASVCSALSLNPALGIIHQGDARALLFDLADVYKQTITLPIAFASAKDPDPAAYVRRNVRSVITKRRLLEDMVTLTMRVFSPFLSATNADELLDDHGVVPGHTNYASEAVT